jgi:hypothetical protein
VQTFSQLINETIAIKYGRGVDKSNPEIKKLQAFLASLKKVKQLDGLQFSIVGQENIVNVVIKDPNYQFSPGIHSMSGKTTMSGQEYDNNKTKMQTAKAHLRGQLARQKKINLEDLWDEPGDSVGMVLADYYS